MEFESDEDVYYFYSCYAKEKGFGIRVSNTWYRRKKGKQKYLKETFLAGMSPVQPKEGVISFFEGLLHKHTPLKDFLSKYDGAVQKMHQEEAVADSDSVASPPAMRSRLYFELQLSRTYTNNIFKKFQTEVDGMHSCFSAGQVSVNESVISCVVKEDVEVTGNGRETMDFEVTYNASEAEVSCLCGLFNSQGYLCRHALSILHQNGMELIPPQYILSRWRKDIRCDYVVDRGCNGVDVRNLVHRYDHLYRRGVQVVEEGRRSEDRCKFALQAWTEILNKVRLAEADEIL